MGTLTGTRARSESEAYTKTFARALNENIFAKSTNAKFHKFLRVGSAAKAAAMTTTATATASVTETATETVTETETETTDAHMHISLRYVYSIS